MLCPLVWPLHIDRGVRMSKVSGVEVVKREDKRTKSWETLTFNQDEQREPRRNREGGIFHVSKSREKLAFKKAQHCQRLK